jgi:AraC-like DNA-binding protein
MEALDNWLKAIHADGIVLACTRVAGPWGFKVTHRDAVMFHFVAEGRAFVRRPGAAPFELRAGELVLFPGGSAHEVAHAKRGKSIPLQKFLALRDGVVDPAAQATVLICGEFELDQHLALPAIRALPSLVHLRATDATRRSAVSDTLHLLRAEVETTNFGNQIVVRNLLSALFVYFMRDWAETASMRGDWFSTVRAPHTARVLARMHEAPEKPWTLEDLAKEAGLSRATFARQFSAMVGEPPHKYLTRWRMGIASRLLANTDLRVSEIGARVGYQSEFAFSRAFKRARGIAPTNYRHSVPAGYVPGSGAGAVGSHRPERPQE